MLVKDVMMWLEKLPQYEEVKWERRAGGTIALMVHDPEDPNDDYESAALDAK